MQSYTVHFTMAGDSKQQASTTYRAETPREAVDHFAHGRDRNARKRITKVVSSGKLVPKKEWQ
jgi:hypothetical protein